MKWILCLMALGLLFNPVMAQTNQFGIGPDNPFHFIEIVGERISLGLTFDQAEKVQKQMDFAEKRLNYGIENNKAEYLDEYGQMREEARNMTQNMENETERAQVQDRLRDRMQIHLQALENARELAPEEAKQGLDTAINNSKRYRDSIGNATGLNLPVE